MGALHEGHLTLIRKAAEESATTVVSIFVNPTQFGPQEDFISYPRDEPRDFELAADAGCDVLFAPTAVELYGNSLTVVRVEVVSEQFEGTVRPGHFDGVATVVTKLFGLVGPCKAYFGEKDLQQCAVVSTLVSDLFLPVALHFVPTVREASGLALSSRNTRLNDQQRHQASGLFATLQEVKARLIERTRIGSVDVKTEITRGVSTLKGLGFEVDYLDIVTFPKMASTTTIESNTRLICAVRLAGVRLLDNIPLGS